MIANGELGDIRVVQAEYPQDWLTEAVEQTGQKQTAWRTDPAQSGVGGSTGDIGTHAYNLAAFITGLELDSLAADLDSFVPGRRLDDNAHVMLRFKAKGSEKPAKGMLWCSQVAPGHENGLMVRVYGTKGGLEWTQKDPNYLWHTPFGESKRLESVNGTDRPASEELPRHGQVAAISVEPVHSEEAVNGGGDKVDLEETKPVGAAHPALSGGTGIDVTAAHDDATQVRRIEHRASKEVAAKKRWRFRTVPRPPRSCTLQMK